MASISRILPPLPTTRDLLRTYELHALKHMSQNFLLDMNICRKIVKPAGKLENAHVCEIGPGPGSITRAILEQNVRRLDLVEKDGRFIPSLQMLAEASKSNVHIHHADVLRFNFEHMLEEEKSSTIRKDWHDSPPRLYFIGNLPFNVATPLIIRLLRHMCLRTGPFSYGRCPLVLTFQKEVAQRMVAPIGGAQRCRLSVTCQTWADVQHIFTIPGEAFLPKPKVDVGVVRFVPLEVPKIPLHFDLVERFCRHFFHYRQKHCVRGVETLFPPDARREMAQALLREARADPTRKCIMYSIDEIRDMCLIYERMCQQMPGLYAYNYRASRGTPKIISVAEKNEQVGVDEPPNPSSFLDGITMPPISPFGERLAGHL